MTYRDQDEGIFVESENIEPHSTMDERNRLKDIRDKKKSPCVRWPDE